MQNSNKAEHGFEAESRRFSYELLKFQKIRFNPQENNLFFSDYFILF